MEYSNTLDDVYNNINDYNPNKNRTILIVFGNIIGNMNTNKKSQLTLQELFIRCKKQYVSCIRYTILFSCAKRLQVKFYKLPDNENL